MIDLFFALFNTGLFVVLMGYAIRKYVVPQIRENIFKQHYTLAQLYDEKATLTVEQKNLEASIVEQEDLAKVLFKKINQWRNAVEVAERAQKKQEKYLRDVADAKVVHQTQSYMLKRVYQQVSPLVVAQLTQDLTTRYSESSKGHSYIKQVLTSIRD